MEPRLLCFIVLAFIVLSVCEARRDYRHGSRGRFDKGGYGDHKDMYKDRGSGYSRGGYEYSSSQLVQYPRCHKSKTLLEVLVLDVRTGMPVANAEVINVEVINNERFETDISGIAKLYAVGCQATLIIAKNLNRKHHQVNLKDCKTSRKKEIVVLDTILHDIQQMHQTTTDNVLDEVLHFSADIQQMLQTMTDQVLAASTDIQNKLVSLENKMSSQNEDIQNELYILKEQISTQSTDIQNEFNILEVKMTTQNAGLSESLQTLKELMIGTKAGVDSGLQMNSLMLEASGDIQNKLGVLEGKLSSQSTEMQGKTLETLEKSTTALNTILAIPGITEFITAAITAVG